MRAILSLLRKDFALFFRDRATVSLTFLVPFALIYLFGQIFGVNRKDSGPSGIPLAVVNQSDNPGAQRLLDALKAEKAFHVRTTLDSSGPTGRLLTEDDLGPLMRANEFRFALVIPQDVVRESGFGLHLRILSNPRNEIETQTVNGLLQKTIFSNVPELLGQSLEANAKGVLGSARFDQFNQAMAGAITGAFGGDPARVQQQIASGDFGLGRLGNRGQAGGAAAPASGNSDFLQRLVKIDNVQVVGNDVKSPQATSIVGGWAMQFLLFALSASAGALFREKEHGLFQRILSAPVTRAQILWSKFLYGVCLGLIQLIVLFFAGRVLFGIEIGPYFGLLVLVCIFAAAACTSFGMLITACSPTAESARGIATFAILLMSAVGGAWFPVSFMPEFIQKVSKFTLVYWSMEGFVQVLWAHVSLVELLPTLGILGGITAAVMALAIWRFNRGRIFE
jgi:ABC-2 type transport system permease protein